jgi:hypothetical protein
MSTHGHWQYGNKLSGQLQVIDKLPSGRAAIPGLCKAGRSGFGRVQHHHQRAHQIVDVAEAACLRPIAVAGEPIAVGARVMRLVTMRPSLAPSAREASMAMPSDSPRR